MIRSLEGVLEFKSPTRIVVNVGGVGFEVTIPFSTFSALGEVGRKVKVLTYLYLKHEALTLFGFLSHAELDMFTSLISLEAIGPRLAVNILSQMSPEEFKKTISECNIGKLTKISGIGKKTAERLIFELKGKLAPMFEKERLSSEVKEVNKEVLEALISLGYSEKEARQMVEKAAARVGKEAELSVLIREALKQG
jgi:Holliday junction DNA helicase RuvA